MTVSTAPGAEYTLAPDVVWARAEDGSSRLFDMNGSSFGLNRTATRMLGFVLEVSLSEAERRAADAFQAPPAAVQADLRALVDRLAQASLIAPRSAANRPASGRSAIAQKLLRGILRRAPINFARPQTEAFVVLSLLRLSLLRLGLADVLGALDARLVASSPRRPASDPHALAGEVEQAIAAAALKHPLEMACKERSLCAWYMLRRRGVAAELIVGVTLSPVVGHCWCRVGGRIVADSEEKCGDFQPVWRYPKALGSAT